MAETIESNRRPPLGQHVIRAHFALEKDDRLAAVPPDSILAAAERAATMVDIEVLIIKVETCRPILVAEWAGGVRVRIEGRAGPVEHLHREFRREQELQLPRGMAGFPRAQSL